MPVVPALTDGGGGLSGERDLIGARADGVGDEKAGEGARAGEHGEKEAAPRLKGAARGGGLNVTLERLPAAGLKAGLLRIWRAFQDGRKDTLEKQGALMIFCPLRSGQHHFSLASGENVRRRHNSNLPLSIFAAGADFIGEGGPFLIAPDLLPVGGEFLSGGEARREDFHL